MALYRVLFYVAALITVSLENPFIYEDSVKYCSYLMGPKSRIETTSKTLTVKFDLKQIYFKLCGKFDTNDVCPIGTTACVENHKTGEKYILGTSFLLDDNLMKFTDGRECLKNKTYSLIVHLQSMQEKPHYLKLEENCTYHVEMLIPQFKPICGVSVYGRFLDLSPLAKSFKVHTPQRNFSVTLCGPDPSCGPGVSACEIIGNTVTSISMETSLSTTYVGEKNQLAFHGSTYKNQSQKAFKFEVLLKCDWDKTDIRNDDLTYVAKQTQGKKYKFELETSYGCVKKSISCIVRDEFLVYNLSKLYTDHPEMWIAAGAGKKNSYFLQICGSAHLAGKNTSCKSTYAQVCENVNGTDINRGSILTHLEVNNDGLRATIESGARCTKDLHYKTIIDLKCDDEEMGPKFLTQGECDTYFEWKTRHACPEYNTSSCTHIHREIHGCVFNINNNYYNLSKLTATQIIEDGEREFKFNICGPVLDANAPCMKDVSVAMKNINEPNKKLSITSLGKFFDSTMKNGNLVVQYSTGAYCHGGDYKSEIHIECSDVEKKPVISKKEKCYYEFVWSTKYGCPHTKSSCSFDEYGTNKRIDFGHIAPIELNGDDYKSIFHLCEKMYSKCGLNDEECTNISFENPRVALLDNETTLELDLPETCLSSGDFNKTTFRFICDRTKNNYHLGSWKKVGCVLIIEYFTDAVCPFQHPSSSVERSGTSLEVSRSKDVAEVKNEPLESPVQRVFDCSIKSPFTNHELNLRNLTNEFFKHNCPTATFNASFRFVKLLYSSSDVCRPIPSKNITYEVFLLCTDDVKLSSVSVNEECLQHYNYERIEYCSFFKSQTNSSVSVIVGTVLGCMLIISLISVGFLARHRRICCFDRLNYGLISVYQRDAQI